MTKLCHNSFEVTDKTVVERDKLQLDSGCTPGHYNQESAKKWVLLRSVFWKDFSSLANVPGQLLWGAEFLRDDFASRASIYKIDEINMDTLEGLWTIEISEKHQRPQKDNIPACRLLYSSMSVCPPLPYSQARQSSGKDSATPEDY